MLRSLLSFQCGHRVSCLGALLISVLIAPLMTASAEFVAPSPYWRNTIQFPSDSFRKPGPGAGDPAWIKFLVFTSDPTRVYFQDSVRYPFHYDFATTFVREYLGMTTQQFDEITLWNQGRQAILGSVILPYWSSSQLPAEQIWECGIELVGQDAFDPAQVVSIFNLVKSKIIATPGVQTFYFPTYEQAASAEQNRQYFADHGITISSSSRWATGNVAYSRGWALGTLKQFPASDLVAAYQRGDLTPADILLTDGAPAEMPIVAGIISLVPSTPSSHVAILAGTYGLPFVYLALPADAARAQSLVGRKVVLRAYGDMNACDARLIDVQDVLTPEQISEILALKTPPPLDIAAMTPYGAYTANTDGLWPADIRYFGGKAANFGLLRRSIPANCPVAMAISFDVWNEFLDQTLANGRILRQEIAVRLAGFTYPPADMAALSAALEGIREDLFKKTSATSFSPALQSAIFAALQDPQYGFDPNRNIRFRSSSNAEDSEQFSAAGLYDSYSGCLADDLDADTVGPSICDPEETGERGVFRAIRKVFASFYNDYAYLGRLHYGINEAEVGMGILVHHSTPDPYELANGVAVLTRAGSTEILLTSQDGAVSVANPEDGSIPEQVKANVYSTSTYLTLTEYSNLLPHGATVLAWDSEYRTLVNLLVQASNAFAAATGKTNYMLDFEYKKVAPSGQLRIKQIRELPQPSGVPSITPFLVSEPTQYEVPQGTSNVFANHRLKSRWTFVTRSIWLTPENLAQSIYENVALEYMDSDGIVRTTAGAPSTWPEAVYFYTPYAAGYPYGFATDTWVFSDMTNPRRYTLQTDNVGLRVSPSQCPVMTVRDFVSSGRLGLQCQHDRPVPSWVMNAPALADTDRVGLLLPIQPKPGDLLQTRTMTGPNGVSINTQFYWPDPPPVFAGYTAPLARWVETRITGYTKEPIILHGQYSQTYGPEHHNFTEHFAFEPRLEPGISPSILQQLAAANIRLIHAKRSSSGATVTTYGFETPADLDRDGDVDGPDVDGFAGCMTGPGENPPAWGCRSFDFDRDGDIDQGDFGPFQRCLSGDKVRSDPTCVN